MISDVISPTYWYIDGGGIRGYSSLLILKEIMKEVEVIERKIDANVDSSFHPLKYMAPHNKPTLPRKRAWRRKEKISTRESSPVSVSQGNTSSRSLEYSRLSDDRGSSISAEPCRYLPCHYWDYIAGTSTG